MTRAELFANLRRAAIEKYHADIAAINRLAELVGESPAAATQLEQIRACLEKHDVPMTVREISDYTGIPANTVRATFSFNPGVFTRQGAGRRVRWSVSPRPAPSAGGAA